jgi:outer membrane protein assembly factor BamB
MKTFRFLWFTLLLCGGNLLAQEVFSGYYSKTFTAGASATSIDSLIGTSISFRYPIYDITTDSLNAQVVFSCRQTGEGNQTYLNKGGFASISASADTILWKNETALYDLQVAGKHLLASNEKRSVEFNLTLGYDRQHFDRRISYMTPTGDHALVYLNDKDETLSLVDLNTGLTVYTLTVPRQENWSDVKNLNDSVIIVAAAGLHALDIRHGLLWSIPLRTAVLATGPMIYSPANAQSLSKTGAGKYTATNEAFVTQLSSNILIRDNRIYFANPEKAICVEANGNIKWESDLRDYDPAKMVLEASSKGIMLVNFGLGVHSQNFVILNSPFVLMLDHSNGDVIDQFGLSEIGNLIDFMNSARGFSFGGKTTLVEIRDNGSALYKSVITIDSQRYGQFRRFIDGDQYHTLKEGYHVPLNFIDDQLVYFLADNNKIYGISGERLVYEYHFTELHRLYLKIGDRNILEGLEETIITNRNFELLATINLSDRKFYFQNKLYFIEAEKIHIVDLKQLRY